MDSDCISSLTTYHLYRHRYFLAVPNYLWFPRQAIREGSGIPLQCSCLENPRDGGAWWAAVYEVAQSRTRLKQLGSSSRQAIPFLTLMSFLLRGSIFSPRYPDLCPHTSECPSFLRGLTKRFITKITAGGASRMRGPNISALSGFTDGGRGLQSGKVLDS